jgi:hypothetical protein
MSEEYLTFRHLGRFGAFGNQLWQIAGTIGEANKLGKTPLFPKWEYQKWFSIPEEMFTDPLPRVGQDSGAQYFQNLDHWWHMKETIFSYLEPSAYAKESVQALYPDVDFSSLTAIHVRRANNLQLPNHHPVPTAAYFSNALKILGKSPKECMVFSDDLEWCREQSFFDGAQFAVGNPPEINVLELTNHAPLALDSVALDYIAMTQCYDFIISNSTFSLWAALMSTYKNKDENRVVVPRNWYGELVKGARFQDMFKHQWWIQLELLEDSIIKLYSDQHVDEA